MARKKPHEEHENHERWLVSYADFITLLFAFFVVMYAISSVNEGKYRVLSDALVAAFRSSPKSLEPIQIGSLSKAPVVSTSQENHRDPAVMKLPKMFVSRSESENGEIRDPLMEEKYLTGDDQVNISKIADEVEKALAGLVEEGMIKVNRNVLWTEVEIRDSILFPSGSAQLQPDALPVLEEVAGILREFPNPIRVEGHTDNVPINTIVYPSNWELSAARATSVVRLFAEAGIAPARMVAQGYGEYRPVAGNDTPEGRARNRRVVIVVLADKTVERLLGDRVVAAQRRFIMPAAVGDESSRAETQGDEDVAAQEPPALPASAGNPAGAREARAGDTDTDEKSAVAMEAAIPEVQAGEPGTAVSSPQPVADAVLEAGSRRSGGPPPRLVRWRSATAATVPVPAPAVSAPGPLSTSLGLSFVGPPIKLGRPVTPLAPVTAPSEAARKPAPAGAAPPAAAVPGETLSEITRSPLGGE